MSFSADTFVDTRDFDRIARAIRFIDAEFREQPRLSTIAAHVGLSEFHFNRLFRRWAGVTPKQYLARVTGSAAREALVAEPSVLEAAHAVGLSGPGRLHDLVVALDAVTPGELKSRGEGVTISYGFSDTPFGTAAFGETPRGLCHLSFVSSTKDAGVKQELAHTWERARFTRNDERAAELARHIWSAESRKPLKLAVTGTNFQLKVWEALLDLGAKGHTTYGEIAQRLGTPGSSRAVGNAVGANPVGWLIPCHHVLRSGGGLGGYRWGEDRKRAMLAWESLETSRVPSAVMSKSASVMSRRG